MDSVVSQLRKPLETGVPGTELPVSSAILGQPRLVEDQLHTLYARLDQARAAVASGDHTNANAILQSLIESLRSMPDDDTLPSALLQRKRLLQARAYAQLGTNALEQGMSADAHDMLEHAVTLFEMARDVASGQDFCEYAGVLEHLGRYAEAIDMLRLAAESGADSTASTAEIARIATLLATEHEQHNRFVEAAGAYREAAFMLVQAGKLEESLAAFARVTELLPESDEDLANYAEALRLSEHYAEAIQQFEHVLAMKPYDARFWAGLGAARLASGDHAQALADLDHALTLEPTLVFAVTHKIYALRLYGRLNEALTATATALGYDPQHVDLLIMHADLLDDLGRYDEALTAIDTALRLLPDNGSALALKAGILRRADRLPEALATIEHALALAPDDPRLRLEHA
ncbi:MAG: tetratricopeptide repeat protein, partial [Chloroflexi bacterium]|nr:tetratricopeptide repeat protein [Chloroflexota bacterium]